MGVRIKSVSPNSIAFVNDIRKGDLIVEINGSAIENFIDFQYYTSTNELVFNIRRGTDNTEVSIERDWEDSLGIELEDHRCRTCVNNCIFCFIDQMPPGIRDSLHIKDDDHLFSFVFGNFITLTNLTDRDLDKIIDQNLTPLYVSVHTTNPELHKKMIRYSKDFDILDTLEYLDRNMIDMHTQIVVIPGWNDGKELESTINTLANFESVLSIGIVPVGLTKFRDNLTQLSNVDKVVAKEILDTVYRIRETRGIDYIWASDEIYLLAEHSIPDADFYQDYSQLENGIGMIRLFTENWKENLPDFRGFIEKTGKIPHFVTGRLFFKTLTDLVKNADTEWKCSFIRNMYLGEMVTVAGLISSIDLLEQIEVNENEILVLPSNMFNPDGYTIDGSHENILLEKFGNYIIADEQFSEWMLIK